MRRDLVNILLVEDNPDHVLLIKEVLEENEIGKRIFVVNDGLEALDFLYHGSQYKDKKLYPRPDLILLDIKLPKLDGLEVLRRIKRSPDLMAIPVVILSTSLHQDEIAAAYKAGVNSYVSKPVVFSEFVNRIKQINLYWLLINSLPDKNL